MSHSIYTKCWIHIEYLVFHYFIKIFYKDLKKKEMLEIVVISG